MRIKDAAPNIDDDPYLDRDDAVAYTWLDHSDSDNGTPAEENLDFVDIDIDQIPTLHDVVEYSFEFSRDDSYEDSSRPEAISGDSEAAVTTLHQPSLLSDSDADSEMQDRAEASRQDNYANTDSVSASEPGDSTQAAPPSLEDVFNLARHEPKVLQRALMGLACIFQVIAAAALWRAIGDKVVVTELVPPLVYASIGVVVYLLGMRYLRIHFAQVRVDYEDWLLCEQVMVGADNGVMLKARFGTAYLIWEQLLGVAQDNDYYYLLIETSQGFKVPKQGVSDPVLQTKLDDLATLTKARALQGV